MSCCNKKRTELSQPAPHYTSANRNVPPVSQVTFQYIGKTALSATGNITGKKYMFQRTGDTQMVDYRDAAGMLSVPVLKRV